MNMSYRQKRPRQTPRRPFTHDFLFLLRQLAPVFVAGFIVFLVLVPISTSVVDDVSIFNVNYTHDQLKYQFYAQDLSDIINFACVIYGSVLAIFLFRFLLEKRSTTAFFSLGLSRTKLFGARYLVGALAIVAGIGIPFVVSLLLNHLALGLYSGTVYECFYVATGYCIVALVAFTLTSIATTNAGTLFETCVFAVTLLCGVTVILWGIGVLADHLLVGNAAGMTLYGQDVQVAPALLSRFECINPLLFFSTLGAQHQFFVAMYPVFYPELGRWGLLLVWLLVFLVLSALAALFFCRRRGEQAEMAGQSTVLALYSVAVFGFTAFAAAIVLLGSVDIIVALVVGIALFLLVSLVFLLGPLRGSGTASQKRIPLSIASEFLGMVLVVIVIACGAFGYAHRIPATEDIASVEVSYNGSPSYLTESFAGVSGKASYYYTSYRTYSESASVDIVRSVHEQLIDSARQQRVSDYVDFKNTVVPYDIVLRYTLVDGREVVRYYRQATIGELSALLSLNDDTHAHELETAVITGKADGLTDEEYAKLAESPSYKAYRSGSIYLADGALNRIIPVSCSDEDRASLLAALAADLAEQEANERALPSQPTRAVLMFTLSPELDVASFGYSFSDSLTSVTDSYTYTMAWLTEHGLIAALGGELDPQKIESLKFQLDDPYAGINKVTMPVSRYFMSYRSEQAGNFWITQDYGALKKIDTQSEIAEMLPKLRTSCYMTGGYLVEAKLRGIEAYVYFYLPSELAPSYF